MHLLTVVRLCDERPHRAISSSICERRERVGRCRERRLLFRTLGGTVVLGGHFKK